MEKVSEEDDTRKYITKKLNLDIYKIESDDKHATTVYPDIVIHKRGDNNSNKLIIEVKKANAPDDKKAFDIEKIHAYMNELKYEKGLYIEFDLEGMYETKYY